MSLRSFFGARAQFPPNADSFVGALATQTSQFFPTHKSHWSKILRWKTQRKMKKSNNDPQLYTLYLSSPPIVKSLTEILLTSKFRDARTGNRTRTVEFRGTNQRGIPQT